MGIAIGLDVYGTLIDPLGMAVHLWTFVGDRADDLAIQWRAKQLEYTCKRRCKNPAVKRPGSAVAPE